MVCCFLTGVVQQLLLSVITDMVEFRSIKFSYLPFVFLTVFPYFISQFHLFWHLMNYMNNAKLCIGLWLLVALEITIYISNLSVLVSYAIAIEIWKACNHVVSFLPLWSLCIAMLFVMYAYIVDLTSRFYICVCV